MESKQELKVKFILKSKLKSEQKRWLLWKIKPIAHSQRTRNVIDQLNLEFHTKYKNRPEFDCAWPGIGREEAHFRMMFHPENIPMNTKNHASFIQPNKTFFNKSEAWQSLISQSLVNRWIEQSYRSSNKIRLMSEQIYQSRPRKKLIRKHASSSPAWQRSD